MNMNRIVFRVAMLIMLALFPSVVTLGGEKTDLMSYQVEAFTKLPFRRNYGAVHCFGLGGSAIFKVSNHFFAKTGALVDLGKCDYIDKKFKYAKGTILEIGVPVMAEAFLGDAISNLNGLYIDLGVVPTYYNRVKGEEYTQKLPEIWVQKVEATKNGFPIESEKASGFSMVPKGELGVYFDLANLTFRGGVFAQYIKNLSKTDSGRDIYARSGHAYVGATLGVVF